jgi:hypothetical protein
MCSYQLYRLNTDGETSGDALELECDDDETARAMGCAQGGAHEALEIWNGGRLVGRVVPPTSATNSKTSCARDVPVAQVKLIVSRASVLTLWASVVAERLGHQRGTALTLGKAVAGTTARLKMRVIGREQWVGSGEEIGPPLGLDLPRLPKKPAMAHVALLGKTIRLLPGASGQLRAALRTLPTRDGGVADEYVAADPAEVERYLLKAFGPHLADVRTAMEGLATRYEPMELNRIGFQLYEKFQPGPYGREGRRGKAALAVRNILAALPHATNHDNNSPGVDKPLHRCFPQIAEPFDHPRLAYETRRVMAEHCQNVHRINEAVVKMQATAKELESAIATSRQLIAEGAQAMA